MTLGLRAYCRMLQHHLQAYSRPCLLEHLQVQPRLQARHAVRTAVTTAAAPASSATPGVSGQAAAARSEDDGLRLVYEPPSKQLSFRTWNQKRKLARSKATQAKVDIMLEGQPLAGIMTEQKLGELLQGVGADAGLVMQQALALKLQRQPTYKLPRVAVLSLVVCDDARISRLNSQHRGKEGPTDVLSFEMDDEMDHKVSLPVKLIGDMVISLDTAKRQADERRYSLRDELRVLLVHGMLHLCGYDHENGQEELLEMAAAEQHIMQQLGWHGQGLIAAVGADQADAMHDATSQLASTSGRGFGSKAGAARGKRGGHDATSSSSSVGSKALGQAQQQQQQQQAGSGSAFRKRPVAREASGAGSLGVLGAVFGSDVSSSSPSNGTVDSDSSSEPTSDSSVTSSSSSSSTLGITKKRSKAERVRLVALDMDGTLLDSTSRVRPSSVEAIKAACSAGTRVILATGKARPAALKACRTVGLEGPNLLVHTTSPGIFLQGLAVHGQEGKQLADAQLPPHVVQQAFRYLEEHHPDGSVSLVAFTGDECVTLRMTDDLQALHHTYYEPLAHVAPSLEDLLAGPPVRKLLFMTTPHMVNTALKPHWGQALQGSGASPMQAVPNMLEIVPEGVDKWVGAQILLRHLGILPQHFMAVGDGGNDLQLVANAGVGVAMSNAVPAVKAAAKAVVASHDEDGIAEAFERFVL